MKKVTIICLTLLYCTTYYSPNNASFGQVFNNRLTTLRSGILQLHDGDEVEELFSRITVEQSQSCESIQQFLELVPKFRQLKKLTTALKHVRGGAEEDLVIVSSLKRTIAELDNGMNAANITLLSEFEFLSQLPQYDTPIEDSEAQILFQISLKRLASTFLKIVNHLGETISYLEAPPQADWNLRKYYTNIKLLADAFIFTGGMLGGIHFLLVRSLGSISQHIEMDHTLLLTHPVFTNTDISLLFNSTAPRLATTISKVNNGFLVAGSFVGAFGLLLKVVNQCKEIFQENHTCRQVAPVQFSDSMFNEILDAELEEVEKELRWIIDQALDYLVENETGGIALVAITSSATATTTTTASSGNIDAHSEAGTTSHLSETTSRLSDETIPTSPHNASH